MFGLLTRPRGYTRARSPRPVRLGLERLETRDCPSTLTAQVTYGAGRSITIAGHLSDTSTPANQTVTITGKATGTITTNASGDYSKTLTATGLGDVYAKTSDSNVVDIVLTDTAPRITQFQAVEGPGDVWVLSGKVSYAYSTQGLVVNFGGQPICLTGKTATVDSNGNFIVSVTLSGLNCDNGTATAQITDAWGLRSNTASIEIFQTPPNV
jgi:hypothetical protein